MLVGCAWHLLTPVYALAPRRAVIARSVVPRVSLRIWLVWQRLCAAFVAFCWKQV